MKIYFGNMPIMHNHFRDDNASLRSASITFDANRDEQDLLNESFASNPTDETVLMQK